MRNLTTILSLFFFLSYLPYGLHAQGKIIEELEKNQLDTSLIDSKKSMYLKVDEENVLDLLDNQPSLAMYKGNYFITGIPLNKEINQHTADVKFQLSIRQRLTKSVLPFKSLLLLTYTQKSFWNIYEKSSPFADNNYNPGLAIAKPIVSKNKLAGIGIIAFEHESNGRSDSLESRDWNYFLLTGTYFYNLNFMIQAKVWAGWATKDNIDIFDYKGYGLIAINYRDINDKIWITTIINPRKYFKGFNTQLELNFKLRPKANQYLFIQYYNGYGESLLEYNKFTSAIRIGICIKPPFQNLY